MLQIEILSVTRFQMTRIRARRGADVRGTIVMSRLLARAAFKKGRSVRILDGMNVSVPAAPREDVRSHLLSTSGSANATLKSRR